MEVKLEVTCLCAGMKRKKRMCLEPGRSIGRDFAPELEEGVRLALRTGRLVSS